jgi:hypothetical protein
VGAWLARRRRALAWTLATLIVAAGVYGYALRPSLEYDRVSASATAPGGLHPTTDYAKYLAALQRAEGDAVDGSRTYAEHTLRWMGWYLGPPGVVLALVGFALLCGELVLGRRRRALPFALLLGTFALLYLWTPFILPPDHIWVMRRFVPVVLPGFAIVAVAALGRLWTARLGAGASRRLGAVISRRWRAGTRSAAVALGLALLAWPAVRSAPLRSFQQQGNVRAQTQRLCRALGPAAAVLFPASDRSLSQQYALTVQTYCDVPVASAAVTHPGAGWLARLAQRVRARGRHLELLTQSPATASAALPGHATRLLIDDRFAELERTVERPPSDGVTLEIRVYDTPV